MSIMTKVEVEAYLDADLRRYVAEMLDGNARSASIAIQWLEIGNDAGARHAIRCAAAYLREAVKVMKRLSAPKALEAAADG